MDSVTKNPPAEQELIASAKHGDQEAFSRLVEPYQRELHAHCYRMLGSLHDAEDALQDAMLRAWRGIGGFDGRSALRSWLYRIATNTSLDLIARRPKRVLPIDYGPAADPHDGPGMPITETVWIEPYPDETLGIEDGRLSPEANYEQREALELAFIAALQHLPPRQRAVLVLREVLGFSAQEVAESMESSVASVNSALQRARVTIDQKLPDRTQQATLRELGDAQLSEIVERYMDAMRRGDVDAVIGMLTDDAAWSMPPAATWYTGVQIADFLRMGPLSGQWHWQHRAVRSNGQPAVGAYTWDDEQQMYLPFALDVLSFEGDRIKQITAFIVRTADLPDREACGAWPLQAMDADRLDGVFRRAGLPVTLND